MTNWGDYFTYSEGNGDLIWKARPMEPPPRQREILRWNGRHAGKVAGTQKRLSNGGRHCIYLAVNSVRYVAHRIIWEMHNGPIPDGLVIDHINGDPWDNRLSNLRSCTQAQNARNSTGRGAASGLRGVQYIGGMWKASIGHKGQRIYIGRYLTKGLAAVARAKAALRYHGEFACLSSTR